LDTGTIVAVAPWAVLAGYCVIVWLFSPRRVSPMQFFSGSGDAGGAPSLWVLVFSAAITWIFAKSIANAASLGYAFGPIGGVGYAIYYLSFAVAAFAIYFIRTRGGHRSLPGFLVDKYGPLCARMFLIAIAVRLFNEVWSNTKVGALYFGAEGSGAYWAAAAAMTAFTVYYSWRGGLRSSLLTDAGQMMLAAVLMSVVLVVVLPPLAVKGLPQVSPEVSLAGLTFCALAAVQVLSYPFHDPVLTDRGFLTRPATMVKGFLLAGLISGGFILLFSSVGIYARAFGLEGAPAVSVPASLGLPMLLIFNAIMLTSAGSTLDSTFASTAKLAAVDWPDRRAEPEARDRRAGRIAMVAVAVLGNAPLFAIYLGDGVGPAVIAATTISGTMVMGLAPIFLLGWVPGAGPASFHLAFWPGLVFGVVKTVEAATATAIFPAWINIGGGKYADDLGINVWGLLFCTVGYLIGALVFGRRVSDKRAAEPSA
jgi:SSS family solute:Na+ symporter